MILSVTALLVVAAFVFVWGTMAGRPWAPCWTWGLLLRLVPAR